MARALRAWAINRGGKNSVRNLRYGPRTRLVRGINLHLGRKRARIFVLGHYLFLKLTVFLQLCSWKGVHFSEQIMPADKYPSMFLHQMEAIHRYTSQLSERCHIRSGLNVNTTALVTWTN